MDEIIYAVKEELSGSVFCCPSGSASINMELTAGQVVRIFNIGSSLVFGQVDGILGLMVHRPPALYPVGHY